MITRILRTSETVALALPLRSDVAAAIIRCDWVEPHVMAAYIIDWQRRLQENSGMASGVHPA